MHQLARRADSRRGLKPLQSDSLLTRASSKRRRFTASNLDAADQTSSTRVDQRESVDEWLRKKDIGHTNVNRYADLDQSVMSDDRKQFSEPRYAAGVSSDWDLPMLAYSLLKLGVTHSAFGKFSTSNPAPQRYQTIPLRKRSQLLLGTHI